MFPKILEVLCKIFSDNFQLEGLKPTHSVISIGRELEVENGTLLALASQYKERFRPGSQQVKNLVHVILYGMLIICRNYSSMSLYLWAKNALKARNASA